MKQILLTQGQIALVDDCDYDSLMLYDPWHAHCGHNTFYAARHSPESSTRALMLMHNIIMCGKGIDHIDHNGLNNQRNNLRFATSRQNQQSRRKNQSSLYKGVTYREDRGSWRARIRIDGELISLGYYAAPEDAAKAYDVAAITHFGEFAFTNFTTSGM